MTADLASIAAQYWAAQQAVTDAKAQVRVNQQRFKVARGELNDAIVAAARGGTRVRDLVAVTGLSREWIRQLLRAAGVEPD